MGGHTPTPWVVGDSEHGIYPIWAKCGPLDVQPATAHGSDDAAFIVKAVNSHDKLVKALMECRTSYSGYAMTNSERYPELMANFWKEIKRIDGIARAALDTIKEPA